MFLIHASTLTTLSSPFDRSPFSFDKPHFCPDLSPGEEPASLVDWKDTGETTAPISFLQEDQISQPSDVFDFENSSGSCLFKVSSLREHVDFWSNSIRASDFIINTIVEGYRIPFFDLPENFVIPYRSSAFKFKDFVNEAISELIERGCVQEVLNPPKFINPLRVVQQSGGKCRLILDLSYLNRFIWSSLFGSKIFALCLICFSQVIFSSPLISNLVTITLKFFQIIASIGVFLGILARYLNTSFLLFCLLVCPPRRTFSVN